MSGLDKSLSELFQEALNERKIGNLEKALKLLNECETISKSNKNTEYIFQITIAKIDINRKLKNYDECENLINNILGLFEYLESKESEASKLMEYWIVKATVLRETALFHRDLGNYHESYSYISIAMQIIFENKIVSSDILVPVIETIAGIQMNLGEFDSGIEKLLYIFGYLEENHEGTSDDTEILRICLLKLGQLYKACNKNEKGIEYLTKSLKFEVEDSFSYLTTRISILQAQYSIIRDSQLNPEREHEEPIDYELDKTIQEYEEIKNAIEELFNSSNSNMYIESLSICYHDLATLYHYLNNVKMASDYILKSLDLKYKFSNEESTLGSLMLQYSIMEDNSELENDERLTEIKKYLTKISNPKKEIDSYFTIGQFLINQGKFEESEYYFQETYHKLRRFRSNSSINQNIRYNVTRRYFRLGFTWAFSRMNNPSMKNNDIWEVLELSQNIEFSEQTESVDINISQEINNLFANSNKEDQKIILIGVISDFVPNEISSVIKIISSNFEDLNIARHTILDEYTHTDIRFTSDMSKIDKIDDIKDFKERLELIADNIFLELFEHIEELDVIFKEINTVILMPYGRLQKLPLEEIFRIYLEKLNINYVGEIVRAISISSYNSSFVKSYQTRNSELKAIIVDNPENDPLLQNSEAEKIMSILDSNGIDLDIFDFTNALKENIFQSLSENQNLGILYHHSSHGCFPEDPIHQSIETKGGSLQMNDFIELNLKLSGPSLATISACKSGTMQDGISSELLGIPFGLLKIGFDVIVSSINLVDIQIAKQFFEIFYKNLLTERNTGLAYTQTKKELIENIEKDKDVWSYISVICWQHIGPPIEFNKFYSN
ncbi:MAG: CHAT domain-containing protein [Candidatus Heimdallarchaeota archaeon]|nr:CHAT domain-containing protein [Candidatus Heimdallarchaeota archaeon]